MCVEYLWVVVLLLLGDPYTQQNITARSNTLEGLALTLKANTRLSNSVCSLFSSTSSFESAETSYTVTVKFNLHYFLFYLADLLPSDLILKVR